MEYNLSYPKLTATITDNASNFVKSFKVLGIVKRNKNRGNDSDSSSCTSTSSEDEGEEQEITNTDVSLQLQILPRHTRCIAHTLSPCLITDVMWTIKEKENLNAVHSQTIRKYTLLWNAVSRPKSAEIIHNILGHTLNRPGDTRWNSLHDSPVQILKTKEKN